jgi:hypothetical protein
MNVDKEDEELWCEMYTPEGNYEFLIVYKDNSSRVIFTTDPNGKVLS